MNVEITPADLVTVAGAGAFVWLVLQFLKGWIKVWVSEDRYPLTMNTAAAILGATGALLGQAATVGLTYESALAAVLVGLGGALMAIGANDIGGNLRKVRNGD